MYRIGIDIGGTFTDIAAIDDRTGKWAIGKVLTTPKDPSVGAMRALENLLSDQGIRPEEVQNIIHGTTLVANALIERKGAKTGLITTKGFRDVLEIRRERRFDMYDIFIEMPAPLAPRSLRREVKERMDEKGEVLIPLDPEEAAAVVREMRSEGVEAVAVCFLHSFRNPSHEQLMKTAIERTASDLFVSLSVEVMPEIREFERMSTTVANAFTQPLMKRYLDQFDANLKQIGFQGSFFVMLSNGGITTRDVAARFPIRVVESGPAAGAIIAAYYGNLMREKKVVSFDMGGTTAKIALIEKGSPRVATDFEVARVYRFKKGSGLPVKLPVIEMVEIGAGGGSIARVDEIGLLKVGPDSAGADPGPACYDLGGEEPTVTDADLILGYLDPDYFLGGKMHLNLEKARKAVKARIADPLDLSVEKAAWGIHQVVDENMANAAKVHIVEKGDDPKAYSVVAFGGAGPVHSYWVAEKIGARTVIYPPSAGVASAGGFLLVPISFDFVRTFITRLDQFTSEEVNHLYHEMEEEGRRMVREAAVPEREIKVTRSCDMRYLGQGHEINIPIPARHLGKAQLSQMKKLFEERYEKIYHRLNPTLPIQCLNWRLTVSGNKPAIRARRDRSRPLPLKQAIKGKREVYFPEFDRYIQCTVYDRYLFSPGVAFSGPAIIEERESTTVVGPRGKVQVDRNLCLMMKITGGAKEIKR